MTSPVQQPANLSNDAAWLKQLAKQQEDVVSRFATLLGSGDGGAGTSKEREMTMCFSESLPADAVVCNLPSLDMNIGEEGAALPKVGEHSTMVPNSKSSAPAGVGVASTSTINGSIAGAKHPVMDASILNSTSEASASLDASVIEQKAAQRLCTKSSWTKSSVLYAPHALSKNVAEAFSCLVDSRVRSWTLLLFRHSLSSGDASSRSRLLSMLSASIKVTSAVTKLKTLALPESAAGHVKEADVILPLLFEAYCDIVLQERTDKVILRAPGTITGHFAKNELGQPTTGLLSIEVNLDTGALLSSMVDQARLAVFKTVAKVTSSDDSKKASLPGKAGAPKGDSKPAPSASLSSFSSSLRLSASSSASPAGAASAATGISPSPRLEKARSSALRLNSVLHGKPSAKPEPAGFAGYKKNRSVQWDHPMEIPSVAPSSSGPSSKRLRMAHTSARLKSFKSFGRPHAGDFGNGPRNATFGHFGSGPTWGRDGKMVNHPSAMEGVRQDLFAEPGSDSNANFSFQKSSLTQKSTLSRSSSIKAMGQRLPGSIPRTATALENWLVQATNGK